jgi:Cytochrome P460
MCCRAAPPSRDASSSRRLPPPSTGGIFFAQRVRRQPGDPIAPGALHDVDLMVKDSKRFADSGGWGYAEFEFDPASSTFRPGDTSDDPPQEHDAKCGFACHTIVADKDYVFTSYPRR